VCVLFPFAPVRYRLSMSDASEKSPVSCVQNQAEPGQHLDFYSAETLTFLR
jgi:hypothetical protein